MIVPAGPGSLGSTVCRSVCVLCYLRGDPSFFCWTEWRYAVEGEEGAAPENGAVVGPGPAQDA